MYELVQISEHDYYVNCPAKAGIVRINDTDVVLIDSGSDKDAGKKILRLLEANGWKLTAIFNTHSHADHIGGNRFLHEKTGCAVYAPGLECTYTGEPLLEPVGLYGGLPFKELKNKFLMAEKCPAEPLTESVLPEGMKLLPLPGHCFEMTGFLTPDGNAFIADCVSSEETLSKYGIGYLWDPAASLETLEMLKTVDAVKFIPAHAEVTEDIAPLAEVNSAAVRGVISAVLRLCQDGCTFEELLQNIFAEYGMTMTLQQYVLIGSTLRSYLSSLYTAGKLTYAFENNRMLWKTAE